MVLCFFSKTLLVCFLLIAAVVADKAPKRGLAFLTLNVAASSISADTHTASGLEYIPMQWNAEGIEDFAATVKSLGAKTILAFNEPDSATQSNINATYAAQLWMQYFEPLKATNVRLGAPAISSAQSGPVWLTQFMAACAKCSIDFIPIHWYGSGTQNFFNYLGQLNKQFPNHPLWVTEFAESSADPAAVLSFMDITVPALDGPAFPFIERYA
ncbi:glycosyl hydrolase catalytic core-domain-containing protein, partial [Mycena filopes]